MRHCQLDRIKPIPFALRAVTAGALQVAGTGLRMIHYLPRMRLLLLLIACGLPIPWLQAVAQPREATYDADAVISELFGFSLPDDDIFWQGDFEEDAPTEPEVLRQAKILTVPGTIIYRVYGTIDAAEGSVYARIGVSTPVDDFVHEISTPDLSNNAIYDDLVSAHAQEIIGRDIVIFESDGSNSACMLEMNVIVCGFSSPSWTSSPSGGAIMGAIVGLALFMDVANPSPESKEIQLTPILPPTQTPTREIPTSVPENGANSLPSSVRDRVVPAAVQIVVMANATGGGISDSRPFVTGSGTVISADGLILTNWHVVDMEGHRRDLQEIEDHLAEEGVRLNITLDEDIHIFVSDGITPPEQRFFARVVDGDENLDFGVLQVIGDETGPLDSSLLDLPFVRLGNSDDVGLGDTIDIYGYPGIGGGSLTFTRGVVSGFKFEEEVDGRAWFTTDAVISAGSSGGTAVNQDGELVGVPTSGTPLECRPGDTSGDGVLNAEDVGCVPIGGSLGELRPINLALELLTSAGWTPAPAEAEAQVSTEVPQPPTVTPALTPTLTPTATQTSTATPTATPITIATATPTMTPTATFTPTPSLTPTLTPTPESKISQQLLRRLPGVLPLDHSSCFQEETEGVFTLPDVIQRLGDAPDPSTWLQEMEWQGGAYRIFGCDGPPDGEAGWIEINVHQFGNTSSAQSAVDYFSSALAAGSTRSFGAPPLLGDYAVALSGPAVNGKEFTIYASQGPLLVRVTGVSPSGIPFGNVLAVAEAVLTAQQIPAQTVEVQQESAPALPASEYLPAAPAVRHRDCFEVLTQGAYAYGDVENALAQAGLTASGFDELGWQDGAYIVFTCKEPPAGRAAQVDVVIHRFEDAQSAEQALPFARGMYVPGENEEWSCDTARQLVVCVVGRSVSGSPLSDVHFVLNQVVDGAR